MTSDENRVMITKIDLKTKKIDFTFVSQKMFFKDEIAIMDFYYDYVKEDDRLVLLMLDGVDNQLLIYYAVYSTLK